MKDDQRMKKKKKILGEMERENLGQKPESILPINILLMQFITMIYIYSTPKYVMN